MNINSITPHLSPVEPYYCADGTNCGTSQPPCPYQNPQPPIDGYYPTPQPLPYPGPMPVEPYPMPQPMPYPQPPIMPPIGGGQPPFNAELFNQNTNAFNPSFNPAFNPMFNPVFDPSQSLHAGLTNSMYFHPELSQTFSPTFRPVFNPNNQNHLMQDQYQDQLQEQYQNQGQAQSNSICINNNSNAVAMVNGKSLTGGNTTSPGVGHYNYN